MGSLNKTLLSRAFAQSPLAAPMICDQARRSHRCAQIWLRRKWVKLRSSRGGRGSMDSLLSDEGRSSRRIEF